MTTRMDEMIEQTIAAAASERRPDVTPVAFAMHVRAAFAPGCVAGLGPNADPSEDPDPVRVRASAIAFHEKERDAGAPGSLKRDLSSYALRLLSCGTPDR